MDMGGRVEDLEIDVFFLFLSFFTDVKFSTFGTPGMEGGSSRRGRIYLQLRCGGGRVERKGLLKGVITEIFHAI